MNTPKHSFAQADTPQPSLEIGSTPPQLSRKLQILLPSTNPQAYNLHIRGQPRFSPTGCFRRRARNTQERRTTSDAPTETTLCVLHTGRSETHEDTGWNEVERRMAAPWANTLRACLVGATFGALWDFAGPLTSVQCLVPAIGGLLAGLLMVEDRVVAAARVSERRRPRSFRLQLGPLLVLGLGTVAFALLEQQVVGLLPHLPFLLRAILVAAIVASFTSVFGGKAFAPRPALDSGTNVEK